jgi:hypothetical protein
LQLFDIENELKGDRTKNEIGELTMPTPVNANFLGILVLKPNTYGPTPNHLSAFNRAKKQLAGIKEKLKNATEIILPVLEEELRKAGAPWIEGQGLIGE